MKKEKFYSKKIMDYFRKPRYFGKMKNPDGVGKVGNPVCGDVMWLYIKVGKNRIGREIIKDVKFETFGCVAAIATSSVIRELAKGKTIDEALKIDRERIIKFLGGLPPAKIHCSVLAASALQEAIYDYLFKNKKEIPEKLLKIHQKIEKEKKEIEKRYKKWINLEEKIQKK